MLIARRLATLWLITRVTLPYLWAMQWRRIFPGWGKRMIAKHHDRGAALVYAHIVGQGGLMIKIGQYVASRPDIFPIPYVDALSSLRDAVPPRPLAHLQQQLAEAYEGNVARHLPRIDPEPLAAASFGQVHRAWLTNGQPVAVKIQYPNLRPGVELDLQMVRLMIALFKPSFPGWPLDMIAEEIERTSKEELDYLFEARNADVLRDGLLTHGLRVPQVHWAHCRERILVMEFAPGNNISTASLATVSPERCHAIATRIVDGFLHQLLNERFFHADPHGGNLLYYDRGDGEFDLWLIDFGMTAKISAKEAELYGRFLAYLQQNDTDGMVEILAKLGFLLPGADRDALKALAREVYGELANLNPRTFKGSRRQVELAGKINIFIRRMEGISFPRHTLMLSRATALIEGLCMDLVPDRNFLDVVKPRLNRFLSLQTKLRWLRDGLLDTVADWRGIPDRVASLQRSVEILRDRELGFLPVIAALALVACLILPPGERVVPAIFAGAALILALWRR